MMSNFVRHWKRERDKTSSSSSPSSSLLEQSNNNSNTNTMENKQKHETTSPRKDAIEEEEVNRSLATMINDSSNQLVEEKLQEQKEQLQMEIPNTNTKTISTLEYDVEAPQLLNDDHRCQPNPSQLSQEQPMTTNILTANSSPAKSLLTSAINNNLLLSSLKGKSQSKEVSAELKLGFKQHQTLHNNELNRVSSSQKSICISNDDVMASTSHTNYDTDNNNAMVPVVPPRDAVNVARRVSSLSLDLNKDEIYIEDSDTATSSTNINLVEEAAMAKPLSIFEETDNSAAQSTSTTTTTTTNNNNADVASSMSSSSSSSTKTNNSLSTKMKTVAEFSNNINNSNITASCITAITNTCTKVAASTTDNDNLNKSSPPSAVSPKNESKTISTGISSNTCSTDSLEPDTAMKTSTKNNNNNSGMVFLASTDKKSTTGKEENIVNKKLTEQVSPPIIRARRNQSENLEGEDSKEVYTPTLESNDNNALIRQLKRLCSFNVPGGSEANGTSLPKRTKKVPQRLRQDNVDFRSGENKNIKHMPVAHSTTTTTTTTTSSPSTSKSGRKRLIEKQMNVAPSTSTSTTTTTASSSSDSKSSRRRHIDKLSQEDKGIATLPGRRRCMRCISNGAPTSQAIVCPGGKGQAGKGVCKFFSTEVKVIATATLTGRRRCMLCIKNGAPSSQAIECSGGKGQSGKGFCKFFSTEVKSVANRDTVDSSASLPRRRPRRCRRCVDNGASSSHATSCLGAIGSYGSKSCEYFEENGTVRKEFKHKKAENKKEDRESILASPSLASPKHKIKLVKGRWTTEEHKRFVQAFDLFGTDWTKVAAIVKTRAVNKVQSYAHNSAFGHTLSNWSLDDYEQFLKKVPESWNLANNDNIIHKLRSKEHTNEAYKSAVVSTHASASCSTSTSSPSHATSNKEGGKEFSKKATSSREAFYDTIQDTAAQSTENIAESRQSTTPCSNLDFNPNKKINASETTTVVNGTEGKSSNSVGNARRCETDYSSRSTSKSTTSDPIQKVFDSKKVTENDDSQECNSDCVPSLLNENGRIFEKNKIDPIDNAIADPVLSSPQPCIKENNAANKSSRSEEKKTDHSDIDNENVALICLATNNNEKDVFRGSNSNSNSNISIHSNMESNSKEVIECQMCKSRREGRGRKIAHDAFCRHSRLYTGPDKIISGTYKRKKSAVSSSNSTNSRSTSSLVESSTMIDTEASTKPTKNQPVVSKYLYAVRKLAAFNEPPENERHDTEIKVTAGGRIHPKRRRISSNFYEPRITPDNKLKIMQEEQSDEDDDTEDDNDDNGDNDVYNNTNRRTRKSTAMKSTKPKTECKACLFGSSYKMGHCVSCPRSRYYDPTVTPASNYTEHQKNKKRGRAEVQLRAAAATTTTTTGSGSGDDDNFDSGNETDPTSNKRKKQKKKKNIHDNDNNMPSSSSFCRRRRRRRNNNRFTVSQDTTRRIITNALIHFQFQDRNHKIRKDHP
jgi:hypothetical protein